MTVVIIIYDKRYLPTGHKSATLSIGRVPGRATIRRMGQSLAGRNSMNSAPNKTLERR
jgi:hypothetical protein